MYLQLFVAILRHVSQLQSIISNICSISLSDFVCSIRSYYTIYYHKLDIAQRIRLDFAQRLFQMNRKYCTSRYKEKHHVTHKESHWQLQKGILGTEVQNAGSIYRVLKPTVSLQWSPDQLTCSSFKLGMSIIKLRQRSLTNGELSFQPRLFPSIAISKTSCKKIIIIVKHQQGRLNYGFFCSVLDKQVTDPRIFTYTYPSQRGFLFEWQTIRSSGPLVPHHNPICNRAINSVQVTLTVVNA